MDDLREYILVFGAAFAVVWIATILSVLTRPQRYLNSFLLMLALLVTMVFLAGFLGEAAGWFLMACFVLVMLALFLVPILLILNGIQMLRKESFSPAHVLSLALGIFVGVGEIAAVVYVLGLSDFLDLKNANFWILLLAFTVFYFSFLVLCFVVYSLFIWLMPHRMNFSHVIIHGCGLAGGERLTPLLAARVDKAIEIYRKCRKKPVIIPSGGQGPDEKLSEARAMKNHLLEQGIPEEAIILEDRSATTLENLVNSKQIVDAAGGRRKTALVSSNYHIYRCLRLAESVGLKCTGIGAKVALYYWPSALIREFVAVFVQKKFLFWSLLGYLVFISPLLYGLLRG